ncbi:MAG: DegT/DnrJ/EryC1/StrS family aminotransferase [Lachnospira sp.]|nr:DegT/DnrJ/EryC1/StrS family aminotransferase [Lachnospira sp.]
MEFRDLKRQYAHLKDRIDSAVADVMADGRFISGPQVAQLEKALAEYAGVKHCITCANGTDAITLSLMAMGVGDGDAVFVPDFTFFASGESPASLGATPVFVDVDERSFNMSPEELERAVVRVKEEGKLVPKAVVAVDLFGCPADYRGIKQVCEKYSLLLLEDGAQGFGGMLDGKRACSFGDVSTTSFFPAKPLGCYGDGGAIFTDNDDYAAMIRSLCVHGKSGEDKYDNIRIGVNSRLDTMQAAILIEKFKVFGEYELDRVNEAAGWYDECLKESGLMLPVIAEGFYSSWAQYTVKLPAGADRAELQQFMKSKGIPTMVYYPKPMHRQGAFVGTDSGIADCPVTEQLCGCVLSLPMHPYLTYDEVKYVCECLQEALD